MNDKDLKYWKDKNKTAMNEIDPYAYLGARGLALIENLEGHQNGKETVDGIVTTYYGITQAGIDGLKELSTKFNTKVPDWMIGADVSTLNRDQCAEVTQYIAALNTMLVDRETETANFSSWDLSHREAFLSYFHNVSPYRLRSSLREGAEGSVLLHIKHNNPYRALQALLENSDGTFIGEYQKPDGTRNGYVKRCLVPSFAYGNPEYTYSASEALELENKMRNQNDFIATSHSYLGDFAEENELSKLISNAEGQEADEEMQNNSEVSANAFKESNSDIEQQNKQASQKEQTDLVKRVMQGIESAVSDFTNWSKNLLTNTQEVSNADTGNEDVNMQQGTGPNR